MLYNAVTNLVTPCLSKWLCFVLCTYLTSSWLVVVWFEFFYGWFKKLFFLIIPYQLLASALWSKLLERHFSLTLVCSYLVTSDDKNNCFRRKLLYRPFPGEFFPAAPPSFPPYPIKWWFTVKVYETWIVLFFSLTVTVRCIHTFACNAVVPVVTIILLFAWIYFVFNKLIAYSVICRCMCRSLYHKCNKT